MPRLRLPKTQLPKPTEQPETSKRQGDRVNEKLSKIERKAINISGASVAWNKLLYRLQFDTAAAERLINHLRLKHPGKNDQWYIEKALYDLDRDRRH